jgi:MerT mercuric transport protein
MKEQLIQQTESNPIGDNEHKMGELKTQPGSLTATLAATLSASCCVLPVILLVMGFTSLGPFAFLMQYRSITVPFSFLMLGAAFYVVYRPQAEADCDKGVCTPKALHRQRQFVWISAVFMVLFTVLAYIPITMTLAG